MTVHIRLIMRLFACVYGILLVLLITTNAGAENMLFIREGRLWISDTYGKNQHELGFLDGKKIESATLSPNGKRAVAACGRDSLSGLSQLFSLQLDSPIVQPVPLGQIRAVSDPSFSPAGDAVVLVGASDCHSTADYWVTTTCTMSVSIVRLDGGKEQVVISTPNKVLDTGHVYSNPAFSPDGKLIAYQESGSDVSGGFVVINLDGRVLFRYPSNYSGYPPFWKPQFISADRIVCWSPDASGGGENNIFTVDTRKGTRCKLTRGANPTLVDKRCAVVFERWAECGDKNSACNLWRLNFSNGAKPEKILENARLPAGAGM